VPLAGLCWRFPLAVVLGYSRRKTALAAWRLPWAGLITGFSIVQAVFSDC